MIRLEDIQVTFNPGTILENRALREVCLEVPEHQFLTVIGSNGAGKSTLLGAVTGETPMIGGQVNIDEFTGGNRVRPLKLYDLVSIQNLKATLLSICIKDQNQTLLIKELLKSHCKGAIDAKDKKCNVKIEYESSAGTADIMLGSQWAITLNEDLIINLYKTFKEENIKILYN